MEKVELNKARLVQDPLLLISAKIWITYWTHSFNNNVIYVIPAIINLWASLSNHIHEEFFFFLFFELLISIIQFQSSFAKTAFSPFVFRVADFFFRMITYKNRKRPYYSQTTGTSCTRHKFESLQRKNLLFLLDWSCSMILWSEEQCN